MLRYPRVAIACVFRIVIQLALFGLVVIMPIVFTDTVGFTTSEWLRIWGLMYIVTIFTNLFWGVIGDKIGWVRQVRWFGCIGMLLSTLAFYYLSIWTGPDIWVAGAVAVIFWFAFCVFVLMSLIFHILEPNHKGAAVSIHNLSAGLSNFVGPAIATITVPIGGPVLTIWTYAIIYFIGFILTFFMKVNQPNH